MDINWDPEDAHRALVRAEGMPSESLKRATIASISAAAQVDIAASLRIIATESALAMSGAPLDTDEPDEPDEEEPLVEGDVVLVDGEGEPGTIAGFRFTEGEFFAEVEWVDGGALFAVSRLTRLVGDEGEEAELRGDLEESVPTSDLIGGDPTALDRDDLVETSEPDEEEVEVEIEADFPDPLEALKAKAAATKRTGSKKGKKS